MSKILLNDFYPAMSEMKMGKPIFDSYRYPNGQQIPAGGFLRAERYLLKSRGWTFNRKIGAWVPPKF